MAAGFPAPWEACDSSSLGALRPASARGPARALLVALFGLGCESSSSCWAASAVDDPGRLGVVAVRDDEGGWLIFLRVTGSAMLQQVGKARPAVLHRMLEPKSSWKSRRMLALASMDRFSSW